MTVLWGEGSPGSLGAMLGGGVLTGSCTSSLFSMMFCVARGTLGLVPMYRPSSSRNLGCIFSGSFLDVGTRQSTEKGSTSVPT